MASNKHKTYYNKKRKSCKVAAFHGILYIITIVTIQCERCQEGYKMQNKTAAITGCSQGIGKAIALKYAKEGYDVAICCRSQEQKLLEVKKEIEACHVNCLAFTGDMGCSKDAAAFFMQIEEKFHHLDVLVNNAGIAYFGLLQDMTDAEWDKTLSTNLSSVFYCSRLAIKMMLPQKSGKILSISSVWGCTGASAEVAYSTSKGGVNAFTKALAKELAPSNIQVNAIACGIIDTAMNSRLTKEELTAITDEIPAGRMGTVDEVAQLAYDINKKNDYLTGQIIILDGGWL
jgi:Dehydrogenases with different specificities (related to short-chain alcohol dehydrogenases)